MSLPRHFPRLYAAAAAGFVVLAVPPAPLWAQAGDRPLAERLAAIEKALEDKRTALGVPGASLVIVRDGKVIYNRGFGYRDVANKKPVTPRTLFAIGSSSKAFTALAVVMTQEDGKLSLDDHPRKYLPYFKLQDGEADKNITVRDLLCHNSGLSRTDIVWIGGVLNREECIRSLADVKPTAPFRKRFQYQNILYAAAGEIAAKAQKTRYEKLIESRIFKPLGMTQSNLSVRAMQRSSDFALGYDADPKKPGAKPLPMRSFPAIAPAGAINSNSTDMAKWLLLMLNNGAYEDRRLVSEAGMAELTKKQMTMTPTVGYGLGWFVRDWNGNRVLEHGGNIDGFNAQVALLPDKKVGFVLLTNVSASPLGAQMMDVVWTQFAGKPAPVVAAASGEPKDEAGSYAMPGVAADVTFKDGVLTLTVPGQPPYPLEKVSGRRYRLGKPAPDGFFVTFQTAKDKPDVGEAVLEQPNGTFTLTRQAAANPEEQKRLRELVGTYEPERAGPPKMEVADKGGKIYLVVAGQPPFPLAARGKDAYGSPALPDTYGFTVRRDGAGKVSGLLWKQPEAEVTYKVRVETPFVAPLTVDELTAKMVAAAGGEAALRRHTASVTKAALTVESQGLTGTVTTWAMAPTRQASEMKLVALGNKTIATFRDFTDETAAGGTVSFQPDPHEETDPDALAAARLRARFQPLLDKKTAFKTLAIVGKETVDGEEAWILRQTPEKGDPITEYVSARSFLVLRRDTTIRQPTAAGDASVTQSERFSDFRDVDGEKVPFRIAFASPLLGKVVATVTEIKFNEKIPDSRFRLPVKRKK